MDAITTEVIEGLKGKDEYAWTKSVTKLVSIKSPVNPPKDNLVKDQDSSKSKSTTSPDGVKTTVKEENGKTVTIVSTPIVGAPDDKKPVDGVMALLQPASCVTTVTKTFTSAWLQDMVKKAKKGDNWKGETGKEFLWREVDEFVAGVKHTHVDAKPLLIGG